MATHTSIANVTVAALDIALHAPFGIATGAQQMAHNVLVCVRLESGDVGWGEAAPFEAVTGETQSRVLESLRAVSPHLVGRDVRAWRSIARDLRTLQSEPTPTARCALETAVLDAFARAQRVPLWSVFGGASGLTLETDMTITTGTVVASADAARRIAAAGFRVIKLKVGGTTFDDDVARAIEVHRSAPNCALLLDANGAMRHVDEALALVTALESAGGRVVLFEQPLARDDARGAAALTRAKRVPIGADEGAASVQDVVRIAREGLADVVNIKISKSGVVEALDMAIVARAHGLRCMIGGMVESEMAMSTSAAIAVGLGGFEFIDLDTPAWLIDSPIESEMLRDGPRLDLGPIRVGHGAQPGPTWLAKRLRLVPPNPPAQP